MALQRRRWSLSPVVRVRRIPIASAGVRVANPYPLIASDTRHSYRAPDDIAAVCCYFNPAGYQTLRSNYDRFREAWGQRSDVPLFTVEVLFGGSPKTIPDADWTLTARDRFFHKEGAINYAARHLPPQYSKVMWLDCDLIWEHYHWTATVSRLLDSYTSVQCGSRIHMLSPRGNIELSQSSWVAAPGVGFPGFAWASRVEYFRRLGLYPYNIVGGGDQVALQGFCGDLAKISLRNWMRSIGPACSQHAQAWIDRATEITDGRAACVDVAVNHLWHGSRANRRYATRNTIHHAIDPDLDFELTDDGLVQWRDLNHPAGPMVRQYFKDRQEDVADTSRSIYVKPRHPVHRASS